MNWPGSCVVTLNPMTRREGLRLLGRRLGTARVGAECAAAEEIVELCGGLPLRWDLVTGREGGS